MEFAKEGTPAIDVLCSRRCMAKVVTIHFFFALLPSVLSLASPRTFLRRALAGGGKADAAKILNDTSTKKEKA